MGLSVPLPDLSPRAGRETEPLKPTEAEATHRRHEQKPAAKRSTLSGSPPLSSPPADRDLIEGQVLVDPNISREPEHALGDNVAQDFVGAASNAV